MAIHLESEGQPDRWRAAEWDRLLTCSVGLILHDATKQLFCLRAQARRLRASLPENSRGQLEAARLSELAADSGRLTASVVDLTRLAGAMLDDDHTTVESALKAGISRVGRNRGQSAIAVRARASVAATKVPSVLVSVLENLIDNGVLSAPNQSPVDVCVERVGQELWFSILDRGTGMASSSPHGRKAQGGAGPQVRQGVALTFLRQLVSLLGGRLEFSSRAGGGTKALLVLPVAQEAPLND